MSLAEGAVDTAMDTVAAVDLRGVFGWEFGRLGIHDNRSVSRETVERLTDGSGSDHGCVLPVCVLVAAWYTDLGVPRRGTAS
ncbi:hypothetical protein A2J03_00055 [Rhodococcus sp. EPR-157]|nr:hypothetical protein A2J03_00055 [Rhodococcus sp. EPR-157]